MSFSSAQAQTPVVNTTISINKTGSEPFDTTTWNGDLTTAGFDEDSENNVVRLQDSITYKVEVSLNDASATDLFATVTLNEKQTWIEIPTGCKTDAADVTTQPVSNISTDGTTLFCNLGTAIEGTTKVFFPAARAIGVDPITGDVTLNNDVVTANVTAGADTFGGNAEDGPTQAIVTAFFRVNTIKEPKINATDPDSGAYLYRAVSAEGPGGEAGWLVEYRVSAQYVKGSMIADSVLNDFLADYSLVDFYTDDNNNNNLPMGSPVSTGGVLYTWDAGLDACYLDGDHGTTAAIACTQVANQDLTASNAPINGYATDGVDDPVIDIELTDIDVRDPDGDSNLFEFVINIWFDQSADIRTHQGCVGTTCTVALINDVAVDDPVLGITGFNPISTEDASGNNLDNYNGAGEPIPNRNIYGLSESAPGSYSTYKSFFNVNNGQTVPKTADQFVPAGSTVPFYMAVVDNRLVDQSKTQLCDKIDTSVYEFAGLSSGLGTLGWIMASNDNPIGLHINTVGVSGSTFQLDGSPYIDILYSTYQSQPEPVPSEVATAATIVWHESLRTDTCEDDVNGDSIVNIKLAGQPAPDPIAPIDWYEDPNEMPGGLSDTAKIRVESTYDKDAIQAISITHDRFRNWAEFDLKVKSINEAYGLRDIMPNWMSSRRTETSDVNTFESWSHSILPTDDFEETFYSTEIRFSDRNILVPSGQSVEKYTEPRGIKVVRAGDIVDFIIEGKVFGLWDPAITTAQLWDNLPNGTDYIVGSEQFSIDGGTTWMSRAEYDASSPDVTLSTAPNGAGADPLLWYFDSVESGDQLPLVRYSVEIDSSLVSGSFLNQARILDTGIGEQKLQNYTLTILPEFGFDVVKSVDYPIYQTNEEFSFDLTYKNLGGENYTTGSFIDILPFIGDGAGTTSGVASARDPETSYSGIYEIDRVIIANNETVYATVRPSSDIEVDPCHESNQPLGAEPVAGDICFDFYQQQIITPAKAANTFAGGSMAGTGETVWVQCTNLNTMACGSLDPEEITALRFDVPIIGTSGGETVTIELQPTGNIGGEPNLDALGNITSAATGDVYTNTFGGRVPEISLNVISNDVSVTVVSGSIGDTIWFDLDGDGEGPAGVGAGLDPAEPPIEGVMVALLDDTGAPVFVNPDTGGIVPAGYVNPDTGTAAIPYVAVTDAMGVYSFDNLPAAEYTVVVTPPAGAVQTYDADDGLGASNNQSTHDLVIETDEFGQLLDVEDNQEQDFGYIPPLQIGSTVWLDIDNSGTQDIGEPGIAGVTVQLFPVGADPITDMPVAVAVTDGNGNYLLNTSTPGDYFVYIPVPPSTASLSSTPPNTTANADSNADGDDNGIQAAGGDPVQSGPVTLTFGGEPDDSAENAPGIGGDQDNLLDGNGNMTVDFGFYPTGSIGDTIWYDLDGDGNGPAGAGDGTDTDESGIAGVTVTLSYTDLDGVMQVLTTTTDISGAYLFDDLPLNLPGDYTVTVDTATLPLVLDTDIFLTSDPNGGDDNTSAVSLTTANPNILNQDFGYQPRGAIGDTIWYDANNDGVIDADETGIEDVTVTLTPPIGVDLGAGPGMAISTMTDENGNYLFPGLPEGQYDVTVDTSTLPSSSYLPTYDFDDGITNPDSTSITTLSLNDSGPVPFVSADLDQDFGFVEPVAVGGYIWSDQNSDGIQDVDELPIEGSTVTLLNADGSDVFDLNGMLVSSVAVGSDGQYLFDNLLEGDYIIQVTKPDGFVPTTVQNISGDDDNIENDSNIVSEPAQDVYQSGVFTLIGGTELVETGVYVGDDQDDTGTDARDSSGNMTIDFGFIESASIGDTVWIDLNNDGIKDTEEDGIADVTINLYQDSDGDGVISGTEATTPVATVETDGNGEYLFPDLTPGVVYQTGVDATTIPDGLIQSFDEDDGLGATDGLSGPITLDPGEFHDTADFGYVPVGSIGDQVMIDIDGDGILDSGDGDIGLEGVTVTLTYTDLDGVTEVVLETQTDENGLYLFENLPGGLTYNIAIDTSTLPGILGDDLVQTYDHDGGLDNTSQTILEIVDNEVVDDLDQDFGYAPLGAIGDKIWYDTNNDGFEDADELGIEGVTVQLTPPDDVDLGAGLGVPITMVTDDSGNYLFENLPVGDYAVEIIDGLPDAYIQTGDPDTTFDNASNVTLSLDEDDSTQVVDNLDQDFGYVEPVAVGGFIWSDMNGDGFQDANEVPIAGSTVTLLNDDGSAVLDLNGNPVPTIVVGQDGQYVFDNLLEGDYKIQVTKPAGYFPSPVQNVTGDDDDIENDSNIVSEPVTDTYESGVFTLVGSGELIESGSYVGDNQDDVTTLASDASGNMTIDFAFVEFASIGDTVWLDVNNDGAQDTTEDGLAGVTVNLYEDTDGDGVISGAEATTPVAMVVTGPNGEYLFTGLTPGVVYQTGVDVTTVPNGLIQTFDEGDGLGATDSLSDPITLDPGEFHDTADFGYGPSGGAIGDTIWVDVNDDGVQDPNELGIGGVTVTLTYIDDAGAEVVMTTMTAPDGTYLFTDLPLDTSYKVEVDTTTLPDGYVSGPSNLGDPDVRDGNSATADNTTYITLTADDPVNLEADFGYLPPADQNNSIGDTIYFDVDGDGAQALDGTEPGIAEVTVALIDEDGNILAVTTTDADGNYLFTGVPDGIYDVVVTDSTGELSDFTQTGDPDGTLDNTSTVELDPLSADDEPVNDLDQDFGYQPPALTNTGVIGDTIFLDANNDGLPDDGEGIGGVVVNLYDDEGNLIATTVTDSNGNYEFSDLETSASGVSYEVRVDTSTLPAGLTNSVDPESVISGLGDSISSGVVLTDAEPENLDQDFGYTSADMNLLSGTVWSDSDGNGMQDEVGVFGGVTIELLDENGNVFQTTLTDPDGNYEFTNLPDGIYTVVVTDEDGILVGVVSTDSPNGTSDTSDQTSKDDTGYVVDLDSAGVNPDPVIDTTGDFGYEPTVTNPITLGTFNAVSVEGGVLIEWATQTEVSNLGFNLYALVDGDWVLLNNSLILSQGDSVSVQSYVFTAVIEANVFALGDIDLEGVETVHGPFILNQSYGEIGERQMIDWDAGKAEREAKQAEREADRMEQQRQRNEERRLRRLRQAAPTSSIDEEQMMPNDSRTWLSRAAALVVAAVIPSAHAQSEFAEDLVNLETVEAGIHQVSFDDLTDYGIDLTDTPIAELAIINQGASVPISVVDADADGVFESGDAIRFIASSMDTLYTNTNVYTLRLDTQAHVLAQVDGNPVPNGAAAVAYLAKARFAPQSSYSFASPDEEDPWYATRIVASGEQSASETMILDLDNVAPGGNSGSTKAKLRVNVWGASDIPGSADDHHIKVNFNNAEVASGRFDGVTQEELSVDLETVQAGDNRVELTLPMDTGYAYDAVNVDEVEVSYPRQFVAIEDRLDFESTFQKFQVSGFANNDVVVMREDSNGVWQHTQINAGSCRGSCTVQFGGTGALAHYYVSTVEELHEPTLAAMPLAQDITSNDAVYLIISHPDFVDAPSLQSLQADLVSEMGSAQIVDVEAIYAQFGYHLFGPDAIQAYIQYAYANLGTQYVLLVGGDVYDYRQFENEDATSFIPSIYASTGNSINFAPVDAKYVDLDGNNVPDLPIGRLPVRTVAELDSLLSKRLDYLARTYQGKVLLVADEYDAAQQYDFASDADEVHADFLGGFDVTKAYVDTLGVQAARASVVDQINAGQSMTAFFGHSSTNQWAFNGLFTGNDAASLSNYGKPTVVTQWGCWNAYYVSPNEDSMGHRFMMEGDQGAVAVMGASTLTNANSERKLARLVLARIANGERLGDAITNAKQEYALENPDDLDVLLGWTLLGLPDLIIN